MSGDYELDVDESACVECGAVYTPHRKDGAGECPDCAEKP